MKKKLINNFFIIIFIFLIILFIKKDVYGNNFSNPIISNYVDKNYEVKNSRSPAVLYENGILKMWFMNDFNSSWNIDYLESFDGINWKKPLDNPVLNSDADETEIMGPTIIKVNNLYHLWYFSLKNNNSTYFIRYAYSYDGLNWHKNPNKILFPTYSWELKGLVNPYVLYVDNKFKMWYGAWGNDGLWRIGYAESYDGINWFKNENPLNILPNLQHVGNHSIKFINNKYYLWYVTGNGFQESIYRLSSIDGINWNCELKDCLIFNKNGIDYPNQILNDLDTVIYNNKIFIYFTGRHNNLWTIGLLIDNLELFPSTTFTPTPTPTKIPIIILPGFMGSWNKEAILHNGNVNYTEWKLAPFVKEYNGLINTLKNLGLKENEDFYVFAYDWRKPVLETVENLNSFINSHLSQTFNKFSLVGHSLGGLVARIYTQKYKDKVNKIISVGSPHQGVVQVYKPIEAGEIDRENTLLWLAQKMILILNKNAIESDRQTIANKFPVAYDLFPTFDFLKNKNNQIIPISSLNVKNTLLNQFNQSLNEIYDIFTAIYGEKDKNTPSEFIIDSPNLIDQVLGNYQDGYPIETHFDYGDYTVLTKSAKQDEDAEKLVFDHGEIITKKEAIKKILDLLGINYNEEKIVEGEKTNIARSLIFLIKSPAKMSINFNNNIYEENDGIIFIPNAETGSYQLNVQGTDFGQYQVIIGQISDNNDIWETINGEITNNPPDQQIDTYFINYNNENSYSIFPTSTPTLTSTPALTSTLTPTKIFDPTNTPKNIPILSQTTNQSTTSNNSNNLLTSNSNEQISSKPTPTPTLILFSKIDNETNKNLNNDNNRKILGEKTEKKEINQLKNKKSNNFIYYSILGIIIFFIFLIFKMYNIFHDKIKYLAFNSNKK